MSLFDKYLLRDIFGPFVMGLLLFFALLIFLQAFQLSDTKTGGILWGPEALLALFYSLPSFLGMLIPMCAMFAILLAVGRWASDSEVLAFCAAGISPYRLLRVPLLFGCVMAIFAMFVCVYGEPWGFRGLRKLVARGAQQALTQGVRPGEIHAWVPGVLFLTEGVVGDDLLDVVFVDARDAGSPPTVVSAARARIYGGNNTDDVIFELFDGVMTLDKKELSDVHRVLHFESGLYRLDVGELVSQKTRVVSSVQAKDLTVLWDDMHDNNASVKKRARAEIALWRKVTLPFATIIFSLLAVPLGCAGGRSARARGFLLSILVVGLYYYIGRGFELSARAGAFSPLLAVWLPNVLGSLILLVLLLRFKKRAV